MSAPVIDADLTGRTILVVEDEFYLAMEIQDDINRAGGSVIGPCADARAALIALDGDRMDAAVVDINLGKGPSFEIADALRARGVPFLFLTGYDSTTIPERYRDVVCIQKPADVARIMRKLQFELLG